MRIPVIEGVIDRRILVNYRVDPGTLSKILPAPFRPKLMHGYGVAGICLIRLKQLRPKLLPLPLGIGSENAAHRIAVEWEQDGRPIEGVYVQRRDTSSRFNALAGGRFFPGTHHHARFSVNEQNGQFDVRLESDDGQVRVAVAARATNRLSSTSMFTSLDEASTFFETGRIGYSPTRDPNRHDGLELNCKNWQVTPLDVSSVQSSFFDNRGVFPPGSANFDCALLMRDIRHEWHSREDICCPAVA